MPIHFNDLDIIKEVAGLSSALIVPCYMCPAVTVAVREKKPFIRFFRNFLKSAPFDQYMTTLQSQLKEHGLILLCHIKNLVKNTDIVLKIQT